MQIVYRLLYITCVNKYKIILANVYEPNGSQIKF